MRRTTVVTVTVAALLVGLMAPASAGARQRGQTAVPGLVVTQSTRSFDATLAALRAAIAASPAAVLAEIDHAAGAAGAGLELPPTTVVYFGSPPLGTPLMQADQVAGIDLPQKMLVWEDRGDVFVAYNSVDYLTSRHDVDGVATLDRIANALAAFAAAAAGVDATDVGSERGRSAAALLGAVERRPGLQSLTSSLDFDTTVDALTTAIGAAPTNLVLTVDHRQNALDAGLELRPTTLLVFGNPNLGTPLMQRRRTVGIDLPQKFLVHQTAGGEVVVTWNDPYAIARRHRLPNENATLATIARALRGLAGATQ